jgi:hypothetical protein
MHHLSNLGVSVRNEALASSSQAAIREAIVPDLGLIKL